MYQCGGDLNIHLEDCYTRRGGYTSYTVVGILDIKGVSIGNKIIKTITSRPTIMFAVNSTSVDLRFFWGKMWICVRDSKLFEKAVQVSKHRLRNNLGSGTSETLYCSDDCL